MSNQDIKGFQIANKEYKVAAYADDLLFFLTKPHISLPNLMKEFSHFGSISNLKINYNKSKAMNITIPDTALVDIRNNCPFKCENLSSQIFGDLANPSQIFEKTSLPFSRP